MIQSRAGHGGKKNDPEGQLISVTGKRLTTEIDSVCVHGDTAKAFTMAKTLRDGLEKAGYKVFPA